MQMTETQPLAEGKTKLIRLVQDEPSYVDLEAKDDITAGDGAKHDVINGKAELATRTTCNVFRLLKTCGIPVAFIEQVRTTVFRAEKCTMLPYEVVIRREAHGSYLDRNPHLPKGHIFPRLLLEFFLKTHGKFWISPGSKQRYELEKDDPLMLFDRPACHVKLYYPGHTSEERKTAPKGQLVRQEPFLVLPQIEIFSRKDEEELISRMGDIARQAFLVLEKAWQLQGRKLVDFKVEFGIDAIGDLRLADVIDNDSWRVVDGSGNYLDKQVYRDGGCLNEVTIKYRQVADITDRFDVPVQRIIFWRGSVKDDLEPFLKDCLCVRDTGDVYFGGRHEGQVDCKCKVLQVTCSLHKETARGYRILNEKLQDVPDAVIIAYVGRSNGAGPILAANCTVPVITVPAGYKEFPEDVWSSLRVPSDVPVMTVLEPANAVLAALKILAARNPSIYAAVRFRQEERLTDL
jgi:phosphoribosylaminoimidazole carboxylase/phosphoribosylaminoimidazole-succinocarboxamide synthase